MSSRPDWELSSWRWNCEPAVWVLPHLTCPLGEGNRSIKSRGNTTRLSSFAPSCPVSMHSRRSLLKTRAEGWVDVHRKLHTVTLLPMGKCEISTIISQENGCSRDHL